MSCSLFSIPVSAGGAREHTHPNCVDTPPPIGGSNWGLPRGGKRLAGGVPLAAALRRISGRRVPRRTTRRACYRTEVLGVTEGQDRNEDEGEEQQSETKTGPLAERLRQV